MMQRFMTLSCVLAIAVAAPQGYNYSPQQTGSSVIVQQYAPQYGSGGVNGGDSNIQYQQAQQVQHAFASFNPAPALPSAGSVAAAHKARPHQPRQVLPPIVSKHIFYHAAADEPDEEIYEDNSSEQQRKHYNVVFIKAPHQSIKQIASQTAQALNEERTAIYVLSKKNDVSEIRQAIADSPHKPVKPEVFFIKYRTPEEAQHAQQTIQGQYDALGGSTNISNEGFAPISSVVGALDSASGQGGGIATNGGGDGGFSGHVGHSHGEGTLISSGSENFVSAPSNNAGSIAASYLPPARRY